MSVEVQTNIQAIKERIARDKAKMVFLVTTQALKDSNKYCRQQSGDLIRSSLISTDYEKGLLVWNTPYAKRVYWTGNPLTNKNPHARLMWADYAKAVHNKEWLKIAQRGASRGNE
jgi:hypothetical protein